MGMLIFNYLSYTAFSIITPVSCTVYSNTPAYSALRNQLMSNYSGLSQLLNGSQGYQVKQTATPVSIVSYKLPGGFTTSCDREAEMLYHQLIILLGFITDMTEAKLPEIDKSLQYDIVATFHRLVQHVSVKGNDVLEQYATSLDTSNFETAIEILDGLYGQPIQGGKSYPLPSFYKDNLTFEFSAQGLNNNLFATNMNRACISLINEFNIYEFPINAAGCGQNLGHLMIPIHMINEEAFACTTLTQDKILVRCMASIGVPNQ